MIALSATALAEESTPPSPRVTCDPLLAVGGDVNLGRRQNWIASNESPGAALGALSILRTADLSFVNLESVAAATGYPFEKGERASHYFRGRPEMASILGWAGIDVVGLANNHSLDYGMEALKEQIGYLEAMGIGHSGAGADSESACAPVFRMAGPLTVAIFSIDATIPRFAAGPIRPGICHLDPGEPERWALHFSPRIAEARISAHLVFVAVHWGKNFAERPTRHIRDLAHLIIDAGADGILGSSAHVLHGVEVYRNRPILYDSGDLLMDSIDTLNSGRPESSAVFTLGLGSNGVERLEVWPIRVGFGRSEPDAGEGGRATLARFAKLSAEFGTDVAVHSDHGSIALPPPPERPGPSAPLLANPPRGPAPGALLSPPVGCTVVEVPIEARIEPLPFGPLTLIGLAVAPLVAEGRQTVWMESYWTTPETLRVDFLIDPRLQPRGEGRVWRSAFHQPCDWQWPTTRWRPGTIYRDRYGIRPPRKFAAGTYDLKLIVRAGLGRREVVAEHDAVATITLK